jgi:hypothetical protein
VRPWQSAVPDLEESVTTKIQFPSDDEETGLALIGYRGPKATVSNVYQCKCGRHMNNET